MLLRENVPDAHLFPLPPRLVFQRPRSPVCRVRKPSAPVERCWFVFTGYGTPLVHFAESFGERGMHREICDDFTDILDSTLETVKKACFQLK